MTNSDYGSFAADGEAPPSDATLSIDSGKSAIISDCQQYRYRLGRRVGSGERICLFVMLNPSTADAELDDPTIRRCIGFAERFGCGRLEVVNLFAFRTKSPRELMKAMRPIGPENDDHMAQAAREATESGGKIICAWGADGDYLARDKAVMRLLNVHETHALGLTSKNMPRHPLYLRGDSLPVPYPAKAEGA